MQTSLVFPKSKIKLAGAILTMRSGLGNTTTLRTLSTWAIRSPSCQLPLQASQSLGRSFVRAPAAFISSGTVSSFSSHSLLQRSHLQLRHIHYSKGTTRQLGGAVRRAIGTELSTCKSSLVTMSRCAISARCTSSSSNLFNACRRASSDKPDATTKSQLQQFWAKWTAERPQPPRWSTAWYASWSWRASSSVMTNAPPLAA